MTVDTSTTQNTAASVAAYGSTAGTRKLKQTLDSEDFMKLLAVQFQSQDPMKPMEDTAFIAQMAQFSALEQSNSMVKEMSLLRAEQQNLAANGMLGRTVTVSDTQGNPVTGMVGAVESSNNGPVLVIDGVKYPLTAVQRIEYQPPAYLTNQADLPPAA
jgi:flagellar basal-body rod modification protein FlgD